MAETKFTPGPWTVGSKGYRIWVDDARGRTMADVPWHDRSDKHFVLSREAGFANARLIAASPVMFGALEQIATGEIAGEPENYRDALAICRDIAREALDAARLTKSPGVPE